MSSLRMMAPIAAGLILVLTYLLVQGTATDTPRHERADALQAVILNNAALQRDVLRARAGLLLNYDPLVRSMAGLTSATAELPATRDAATGETRARIDRKVAEIAQAVRDEEALVETFKSDNALLQNSLSYFNYLSGSFASAGGQPADVTAEAAVLTAAMFRFINAPRPESTREVEASLDRLERRLSAHGAPAGDVGSLIAHGRLIVSTLPAVDNAVARLQGAPTSDLTRTLQDIYLESHEQAALRSDLFMALLYGAALLLVAYVVHLFIRLRANAQILRDRLQFEGLIASISTKFINLPREGIGSEIDKALAQLVEHAGIDDVCLLVLHESSGEVSTNCFRAAHSQESTATILALARNWTLKGHERQGCIFVADVDTLPDSREKTSLHSLHIRSWLCLPLRVAGEPLGFLTFHGISRRAWRADDIALLRTAGEIFANALAREGNEAAREALQARLNQSQRLEAIGTLAGGMAHEFNNILGAIRGYGEMALDVVAADSRARRHIRQIMKAGARAQGVIEQVLAFGRRRERRHKPISVEPVVTEAVGLIRASFPSTLSVKMHLAANNATMVGDPTELQQVVMNLCTNAVQAMDGRGVLDIDLDTVERGQDLALSHGSLPAGRHVRLAVRDTGQGIDPAVMERIFEPFFTTKPAGKGTGLGLSTVHGIVGEHGGAIHVESRLAKGTRFEVFFPLQEGAADDADGEETKEAPVPGGHGETVLIVDDDKSLMLLGEEMLAALGYEPVGFEQSQAALTAFRAAPQRFDLVLTDEIMPEVTGTELADALHRLRPDLPIVLMTGYGRAIPARRLEHAGIREVLKKPLLTRPLAECMARHLTRHSRFQS
ncbi:two-component system VirA-like sensor kinase [Taklimakanibacter deserti]|uniref:two-component system VirA-like sensor kinase n=1 Tax=Taklimakanibacter deserti TaxID=2267839 RepID=UPI000E657F5E